MTVLIFKEFLSDPKFHHVFPIQEILTKPFFDSLQYTDGKQVATNGCCLFNSAVHCYDV